MPYLIQFMLKFSLSLGILYIFYQLVLRPLTFYQWNRFYLVCYSLLSFIIPFINVTPWITNNDVENSALMNVIPVIDNMHLPAMLLPANIQEGAVTVRWNLLYLVMAIGTVFMMIRLSLQYKSLQAIKRNGVKVGTGDLQLYDVGEEISPFSFANAIFLNSRLHSEEELQKIIQHEFVHIKQKHTIDILIGELLCIVNWFNPFAWLIRRAIRQNLEFIADQHVLQNGLDARQYQYLLLKVVGVPQYSITNHFNFSSLKKRIVMMNKIKSARFHLVRFLFVLPMLAVLLLAYRQKIDKGPLRIMFSQQNIRDKNNDTVPLPPAKVKRGKVDTVPAPPVPPAPPVKEVGKIQIVPAPSLPPVPQVPPKLSLPKDVKSVIINTKATIEYTDGRKEMYDLNKPEDKAAYERKFGLLPVVSTPPVKLVEANELSELKEQPIGLVVERAKPLIVLDGKVLPLGTDINSIDPNTILSVDVIKGSNATDLYKDNGVNGVVSITTRQNVDNDNKPFTLTEKNVANHK